MIDQRKKLKTAARKIKESKRKEEREV